ncbi:hypothetical protein TNCV_967861 [Trichonephila clavipes]|nr:hypothetical protein TNCV_967861 [Trichonephila clavipes]
MGVEPGEFSVSAMKLLDRERLMKAIYAAFSGRSKKIRKDKRRKRKKEEDNIKKNKALPTSLNSLTGFDVFLWPANSPDLNSIRHLGDQIGNDMNRGPPAQTVFDMCATINGLIDSMPLWIEACIDAREGIRY